LHICESLFFNSETDLGSDKHPVLHMKGTVRLACQI